MSILLYIEKFISKRLGGKASRKGRDRNYVYKPSLSLLENLGIKSLEELPDFSSVSEKLEEFLKTDTVKIDGNIAGIDIKQ